SKYSKSLMGQPEEFLHAPIGGALFQKWRCLHLQLNIYSNPKKKDTTMELKDIKPFLKYENVKIIVDNHHKDYRNSMHTIISEPLEIEGLYDQKVYEKLMYIAKRKFKMV
ncbi:MAG: hypothetical protein ABSA33_03925, partial [Candidatus Micrarchaeaceae archaeon]